MATGDVSLTVRADGFSCDVRVEGFTTGATYDFGLGAFNVPGEDTPYLTVVSKGFDATGSATTRTRRVYLTHVLRKVTPDQADLDESIDGSDLVFRCGLSEEIYVKDNTGAGNSGTAPTLTAPAGWVTNTGGASQTSNAVSGVSQTNNSTLAYPQGTGQWDWRTTQVRRRKTADFQIGFRADHPFGVACVELEAVGATSSHSQSSTVTQTSKVGPCDESGLYYPSYLLSVPIAGYTQGEQIKLNAIVYPKIGDTTEVIDTSGSTNSDNWQRGDTEQEVTCDKTSAIANFAVVRTAAAGGDDPTGVVSTTLATADASPYATIAAAVADGATVVYLTDDGTGTHLLNEPVASLAYAVEILPLPTDVAANITLQLNSTLNDIKITHTYIVGGIEIDINSTLIDGENLGRSIHVIGATFAGIAGSVSTLYRFALAQVIDCVVGAGNWNNFSSNRVGFGFMGCSFNYAAVVNPWSCVVACRQTGSSVALEFGEKSSGNPAPLETNLKFDYNDFRFMDCNPDKELMKCGDVVDGRVSVIGTLGATSNSGGALFLLWGDGNTNPCDSVQIEHSTWAGERFNGFYNDSGVAQVLRSRIFVRNCAARRAAFKADTFVTANANRDGNWQYGNGCNARNNRIDSQQFPWDFYGINSGIVGDIAVSGEMGYTDENSADTDGTGGGDYTPGASSALLNLVDRDTESTQWFDLYGKEFPATAESGAVQRGQVEDITGQVQVDGTIRLTSQRASGLWGSTITKTDAKITAVSQVTGGTRSYAVGSVTGAGTSTLQVILTPTPSIYSTASGGTVTVTINEGWLTDENGNTTAAFSGIADGDNSSTQEPSGGGGNATKGNFGIHTGIKIGV